MVFTDEEAKQMAEKLKDAMDGIGTNGLFVTFRPFQILRNCVCSFFFCCKTSMDCHLWSWL